MITAMTTYDGSGHRVLNLAFHVTGNAPLTMAGSNEMLHALGQAALMTSQIVTLRRDSTHPSEATFVDYMDFLEVLKSWYTTEDENGNEEIGGFDDLRSYMRRYVSIGNNNTMTIRYPESEQRGGADDLILNIFENIPLFTSLINTMEVCDKFITYRAVAEEQGVTTSTARGASSGILANTRKNIEFCMIDSFAGYENISMLLTGKMSQIYKDDKGNELRISSNNVESEKIALHKISTIFDSSAMTRRHTGNYEALQADFKKILRNYQSMAQNIGAERYRAGYNAAMKAVKQVSQYGNMWHLDSSTELGLMTSGDKPYVVYNGPRIHPKYLLRNNQTYVLPTEISEAFFIDSIAVPLEDMLHDVYAKGWFPHRAAISDNNQIDTAENEMDKWSNLCIGELDRKPFERFIDLPEMMETIYFHSMYGGMPTMSVEILCGFLEYNEDIGDYYNTHDGSYYSKRFIEEQMAPFHKYMDKLNEFERIEMFNSSSPGNESLADQVTLVEE